MLATRRGFFAWVIQALGVTSMVDKRANGDGEDGPLQIKDSEEYSQSRRLQELYDARQRLRERRDDARVALAGGHVNPLQIRSAYRRVLKSYLMEIEPLMTTKFADTGQEYWENAPLGTMVIDPPPEGVAGSDAYGPGLLEPAEPWEWTFEGIGTLVEMPSPVVVSFEWETASQLGNGSHVETVHDEVPWHVMDKAYRLTNEFLADIGFEIEAGRGLDAITGFDQSGGEPQGEYANKQYDGAPDL